MLSTLKRLGSVSYENNQSKIFSFVRLRSFDLLGRDVLRLDQRLVKYDLSLDKKAFHQGRMTNWLMSCTYAYH